jgi:hypothetical protein
VALLGAATGRAFFVSFPFPFPLPFAPPLPRPRRDAVGAGDAWRVAV